MLDTQKRVVNEAMGGYALGVNVGVEKTHKVETDR
jgi:hypothetical protein